MENVILTIHLILATVLIAAVLMQRSEGGGLGFSTDSGVMSGRSAATALNKVTWFLAVSFLSTSITLTILAANKSGNSSILDQTGELISKEVDNTNINELKAIPDSGAPATPPKDF
jgi:preprotein translocase subunit SecG